MEVSCRVGCCAVELGAACRAMAVSVYKCANLLQCLMFAWGPYSPELQGHACCDVAQLDVLMLVDGPGGLCCYTLGAFLLHPGGLHNIITILLTIDLYDCG